MEPGIPTIGALRARCSFSFTRELFLEYSRICDFMSKWKKWFAQTIIAIYFVFFCFLLAVLAGFSVWIGLLVAWVFVLMLLLFITAFVTRSPPLWLWKRKQSGVMRMYAERLGFDEPDAKGHCFTWFEDGLIGMETEVAMMEVPIDDVRWVRRSGDLVVIGCLDDSSSMDAKPFMNLEEYKYFYRAIPGIAFLASGLQGMDANELIEMLQPYVRQHRRDYFAKLRFWERWHAKDGADEQ